MYESVSLALLIQTLMVFLITIHNIAKQMRWTRLVLEPSVPWEGHLLKNIGFIKRMTLPLDCVHTGCVGKPKKHVLPNLVPALVIS